MDKLYRDWLFRKEILVSSGKGKEELAFPTLYALASLFQIKVVSGGRYAEPELIRYVSEALGKNVPEPFYRGVPESVRRMSRAERLFDQMFHYVMTYGLGHFESPGHSLFEGPLARSVFRENVEPRCFRILTEEEAWLILEQDVRDLLASSRPLSDDSYDLVLWLLTDRPFEVERCASKNTVVRLLLDTRQLQLTRYLRLSDVMQLLAELQYRVYDSADVRALSLKNRDRVFLTQVIDRLILDGKCDVRTCCEKKALWRGLLHHIHYRPVNEEAAAFVKAMRGKEARSAWSDFERAIDGGDIPAAIAVLKKEKGSGAVLRNLNYLMSRCRTEGDRAALIREIPADNTVVLLQLLYQYGGYQGAGEARSFRFARFGQLKIHEETEEERHARRSTLTPEQAEQLYTQIREKLSLAVRGRLGKVYVDPALNKVALPMQESTAQGGYGVLPKGSRLPLPEGKKIRAFTYWEKVDDIDLSAIGLRRDGLQEEFSWRTMYAAQSEALTFSGDETSGYHGGSEYFDVDLALVRELYPQLRYLIFCDNVFSHSTFRECVCRAGYMLRDLPDSGKVFEPKTVKSSFTVDCDSTFAYLFALDPDSREFVWLNVAREGKAHIAGETRLGFLAPYLEATRILDLAGFARMAATELVDDPAQADTVFSDRDLALPETAEQIHSFDTARVLRLIQGT